MTAGLEQVRADYANRQAADAAADEAPPSPPFWQRLAPAHLTSRIILINVLGLVILVIGILYFNQSRQGLIDARVQSLMTQAQIMAAAVASSASIDTDQIVIDPERLIEQQLAEEPPPTSQSDLGSLDFLINPERAGPVLRRLVSTTDIRARLFDRDGTMVVDSRYFYGRGEILRINLPAAAAKDERILTRLWNGFNDWLFANDYPLQKEYTADNGREFPEITAALNGASVSVVRLNRDNEIIVSVSVPVQRFRAVLGALVLSTKGGEIDTVLRNERRIVLFTFAIAALMAVLLSLSLAGHIAEPIRRLASAAESVRRGVNKRAEIPDFTSRRDEVGHLSGALRDMTAALYNRMDAIEAFAADVAHELKNPLTSLRSAVETLEYARTPDQRERLVAIVKDDVKRLDRLISDISDASRLDAELARTEASPVDIHQLLKTFVELANETRGDRKPAVRLVVERLPAGVSSKRAYHVLGHDNRLGQVVRNLLANASSFAPADSEITVRLRRTATRVEFSVEDHGPGIPPANLERIFERFYTDRPEGSFGKNSGLGLSISRQIVEAHGGRVRAENRHVAPEPGDSEGHIVGARFVVRIPAAPEASDGVRSK